MKVLLTTLNAKYIHSSLALAYLKAFCHHEFTAIEIQEYTINEPLNRIMADIFARQPEILCFSCYIWNIELIRELCADLKKIIPEIRIIVGGPEVAYDASEFLEANPAVDYVIRGEGEETLLDLLCCLHEKQLPELVTGLTYRHGTIHENPERALISDLDHIPFPYFNDLVSCQNRIVYYESSRGCPFHCTYCLSSTSRGVRYFSMDRVKRDLKMLIDNRVPEVKFVDRTFNCNEKRSREIMEFILGNNIATKFHFEIDAGLLSEEMLHFLATVPVGQFDFEIGIQSTNPQTLSSVKRNFDGDILRQNIDYLRQNGNIHLHLDLIAGLPFEDYSRFKISFNDVYAFRPDVIQLGFLKLLKGSPLHRQSTEYGYHCQEKPPYQVLENDYIKYAELIELDHVEDLVSRYYNSGRVSNFLSYIIEHAYAGDAFAFWESLSKFLKHRDFFRYGHKREEEYTALLHFSASKLDAAHLAELLKLDYFIHNRNTSMPAGFTSYNPYNVNEELYTLLKDETFIFHNIHDFKDKTPRERRRRLHLEYLQLDENYLPSTTAAPFLFIYRTAGRPATTIILGTNC